FDPYDFASPPEPEQRRMLQSMLIERFALKFRRETKDAPVYFLVKGNKPWKLTPAKDERLRQWIGAPGGGGLSMTGVAAINITVPLVAGRLTRCVSRTVIDRAGVAGAWDFRYDYGADDQRTDQLAMILESLQAIGLKLESARAPIEMVVIESVA